MNLPLVTLLVAISLLIVLLLVRKRRLRSNIHYELVNPRAAFVNFGGAAYSAIVAEDHTSLQRFFKTISQTTGEVPSADVVFLYSDVSANGELVGSQKQLREIGQASGARLVILASPVTKEMLSAALQKSEPKYASLVVALSRGGPDFTSFLEKLFTLMANGKQMPLSWVELAPYIPGRVPTTSADMIYLTDGASVSFNYAP